MRSTTNRSRTRRGQGLGRLLAAVALAVAAITVVPGAAGAQEICEPPDQAACLVRCKVHKHECFEACTARKRQCLHGVRAELQACKLGCRSDETAADDGVGTCKRRCLAVAIETGRKQCKLGRSVCLRECNPESCRELCAADDEPITDSTVPDEVPSDADTGEVDDRHADCIPPVDRECLGQCAGALRECATRVHKEARACLDTCSELRGPERWRCVAECARTARDHGQTCKQNFRDCAAGCRNDVAVDDAGS